jgi:Ca2+-binding RTX toxin-like protein
MDVNARQSMGETDMRATRIGIVLFTAAGFGAALTAPAQAAEAGVVSAENGRVTYTAAAGQDSDASVTRAGRVVTIQDIVPITAGPGCTAVDETQVSCALTRAPLRVTVALGDGDDFLANETSIPAYADGGPGSDNLTGGSGDDHLTGGGDMDTLIGGAGNDVLAGGGNGDQLIGGDGDDVLRGQAGNDVMNGNAGADILIGGTGDDLMAGDAGDDDIDGGDGDDFVDGGADTDLCGSDPRDLLNNCEG